MPTLLLTLGQPRRACRLSQRRVGRHLTKCRSTTTPRKRPNRLRMTMTLSRTWKNLPRSCPTMLLRIASTLMVTRRVETCPFSLPVIPGGAIRLSRPFPGRSITPGKKRAIYPVRGLEGPMCCLHPREGEGRRQGQTQRKIEKVRRRAKPKRDEARKLVLPGTWTFHGADKPYHERYTFTEAPKRKARRVRPSFREGWKPNRRQSLPAWLSKGQDCGN